jgi:hypothetical protein
VAPVAPQQRRHDDPPRANRLRARDLLRDFERDGLDVYNSQQTNLGAALAVLNHLEDSPAIRRLQANVRDAAAQIEERGPGYSRSAASSYSADRSVLASDVVARVPSTRWLKKEEAKTK